MDIQEKIKRLPLTPGVYLMQGAKGEVLYVGKALCLRKRVASYFRASARLSERIASLVPQIQEIEYIPTSTEAEALIYENSLIKQFSPRYNVALKDGKTYPLLKLTIREKFPKLTITRQRQDDGALYFGPYANATLLRKAVETLRRAFPLRICNRMPKAVCLHYHINQCPGPCEEKIDQETYRETAEELKLFLEGRRSELLNLLSDKMLSTAKAERYEEAAKLRDRIEALATIKEDRVGYGPGKELEELKDVLGLTAGIEVIEAFDVSNIMGKEAVGSMVSFYLGRPKKDSYRRFKIRTVSGIDDYAMIKELVSRRYSRVARGETPRPDLVLIDGGRGHLSAAIGEIEKLGIKDMPVISIAKEFEHIFLKARKEPLILPRESKALHLLKRIRDEAHRFAIIYHKSLVSKKLVYSKLDEIPNVGPKRRKILMRKFKSVDAVGEASLEELVQTEGIDEKTARAIRSYFKR